MSLGLELVAIRFGISLGVSWCELTESNLNSVSWGVLVTQLIGYFS